MDKLEDDLERGVPVGCGERGVEATGIGRDRLELICGRGARAVAWGSDVVLDDEVDTDS